MRQSFDKLFFQRRRDSMALRGFTLIELAIVVVIISVFAALAIPQIVNQMRDRRVRETAQRVMHVYRMARERAIGRGGAVMVRYSTSGAPQGRLEVLDGQMGSADANDCAFLPNPSCSGVDWTDTGANGAAQVITDWDLAGDGVVSDSTFLQVTRDANSDQTGLASAAEICFTPFGRTFVRYNTTDNSVGWTQLTGVPIANVFRTTGSVDSSRMGLTRQVLILPSGAARLETPPWTPPAS